MGDRLRYLFAVTVVVGGHRHIIRQTPRFHCDIVWAWRSGYAASDDEPMAIGWTVNTDVSLVISIEVEGSLS